MTISMDKKYQTRTGRPIRLLCVDAKITGYPVVGLIDLGGVEENHVWAATGAFWMNPNSQPHPNDLVEVSPYADFKIDEPVMVRASFSGEWHRRHFAGVEINGAPTTWNDGKTSFSSSGLRSTWNDCRRPTEEEMKHG